MSEYQTQRAAQTLIHYFRVLFRKSDLKWDADNEAEILEAVRAIVQSAIEPL
jgi:hypothetical protein